MPGKHPAVFFDRDGTLMEDAHYCGDPALVRLYPGVPDALQRLRDAGYRTFVVSNQSGIGRGLITEEQYQAVQNELLRLMGPEKIDASYFCPDAPGTPSTRRKPEPGMVLEAAADYDIDLARSWFVGDKTADVECGHRAGMRSVLVLTGYGSSQKREAEYCAAGVVEAVDWILSHSHSEPRP